MTKDLVITPVVDDPELRVWQHVGESDQMVVCFSGIGPDPDELPEPEFARSATCNGKHTVLYVADPRRSWLNGKGLIERIVEIIEAKVAEFKTDRVYTLGHSMGGYSALVIPGFTKVDVALALSPQVSVHPGVVSDDPRWMNWRAKIADFRVRHVKDHLNPATQYVAIYGAHKREAPQRERLPIADNIERIHMNRTHHNTAQRLKARGLLDQIIELAFERRIYRVRRLIRRGIGAEVVSANTGVTA